MINQNTSYGASVFINADSDGDLDFDRNYTVNPFFRWFFSESKFARGFFIEGFGSLNSSNDYKENYFYDDEGFYSNVIEEKETNVRFALGISTGGKFVLKTGFIAEVFLGIGRNLIGDTDGSSYNSREFIPRGGISLGYRF